jgi:hypothetical protein
VEPIRLVDKTMPQDVLAQKQKARSHLDRKPLPLSLAKSSVVGFCRKLTLNLY